jgi:hypothetical protein
MTVAELKAILQETAARKASPALPAVPDKGEFREQRRRKK